MESIRIASLLPSATEILHALGLSQYQVARSHECDYPPEVQSLPICTAPKFNPSGDSAEIHRRVTDLLQSALSVYQVNTDVLQQVQPTHILTQAQCEVCAVSLPDVEAAVAELTACQPQVLSLQPTTLEGVWQDIRTVGEAILGEAGRPRADQAIAALQARIQDCRAAVQAAQNCPQVACIEWPDPLMAAGNWIPELVELAGGRNLFGEVGQHSPWLSWQDLFHADPEVIVLMPCGYDLRKALEESRSLTEHPHWNQLRAVKTGRVYATDGNQYFNRPGPRLVDSLEILAEILHPDQMAPQHEGSGWCRLQLQPA